MIYFNKFRGQNTKGVWLSRCTGPSLLVMDVDFSDAKEVPFIYLLLLCISYVINTYIIFILFLNLLNTHIIFFHLSQDDASFEKQSVLFALAISDLLIVNMLVIYHY